MKLITFIICILCLASCSSTPEEAETKYYLLNSPSLNKSAILDSSNTEQPKKKDVFLIIDVAKYLQQPFIAMQIDEHTLYYAQSHLWAEPLKNEIAVALSYELNLSGQINQYTVLEGNPNKQSGDKLFVNIEHFHSSNTGNIILTGNFQWLDQSTKNSEAAYHSKQPFYLEAPLESDGFTHSISKMRTLLTSLASNINKR